MKIGIVCYPTFGGSGVIATELGKALANKGHEIHFVTYNQPIRLDFLNENLFYHEVEFYSYPLFDYPHYELALTSRLVDVVKNQKLDFLHVHYAIPHASSAYMARQILRDNDGLYVPIITTLHGTDITLVGKESSYEPVVNFSINQSDAVTSVSESLKEETYQYFKVTKDITVIPNFVDLEKFKKHEKKHIRTAICQGSQMLIVHISNFRKVKRVLDAIRIFEKIYEVIPSKLLMVGDGPERVVAEQLSRELGLQEVVRFLGKQEAVEEILSISDLLLLPSEKESFGLTALEAMACEVPVVSSDVGGLPEVQIDGETGYMCSVGDIEKMAQQSLVILDKDNLPTFKANALKRARHFNVSSIVPHYESMYEQVLEQTKNLKNTKTK